MIVRFVQPYQQDDRIYLPGEYADVSDDIVESLLYENIAVIDNEMKLEHKPAGEVKEVKRGNRKNGQ